MAEKLPPYLYRYMGFSTEEYQLRIRDVLVHSRIYFPRRTQFNDPFDSTANVIFSGTEQQKIAQLARTAFRPRAVIDPRREVFRRLATPAMFDDQATILRMAEHLRRAVDRLGILSLSSKARNTLLWSHYGEKHTGCCLKFRTDVQDDFYRSAWRIDYRPDFPTINAVSDDHEAKIRGLILTKASSWRYEGEWRVVDTRRWGYVEFQPESLVGIICGWRMPARQRAIIRDWVAERPVPIARYNCEPSPKSGFRLVLKRIS